MSDPSVLSDLGGYSGGGRRRKPRRRAGCGPAAAILVVLVILAGAALYAGGSWLKDRLEGPADYAGPGTGHVTFTITEGESVPAMGAELKRLDVVKSSAAFVSAASKNAGATGIQPGAYALKKQMKAADVVSILIDPSNMAQNTVTIPEGKRADDIVALIAEHSDFSEKALRKVLAHPSGLGLPSYAQGDPEGYLFPATYTITPGETPLGLLRSMVAKWREETDAIHLTSAARAVNLDPAQAMTVASILEYEASRSEDYPKVARAIYNRLKVDMPLQSDATVAYANKISGQVWTTAQQRAVASAYNTYTHKGLPPGPIGNPGIETIKAALHPAQGPWLYWVVVNLRTGKTVFSTTYAEHQAATEQLRRYCQTSSAC